MANPTTQRMEKADVTQAIKRLGKQYESNANSRNVERLVGDFYAEDAKLLPPSAPVARGRDEIRALFDELTRSYSDLRIEHEEVITSGDLAVSTGTYRGKVKQRDGSTVEDRGKFVEVHHREGDTWRCIIDTFNSDLDNPPRPG